MSTELSLTEAGELQALMLIAEHLERRNLPVESVSQLTAEQLLQVLAVWGALMTECRTEGWFGEQLDRILRLEKP